MEEGVRLCTMCVDWVFVLCVPSLYMSTMKSAEKSFWGLALGSKLALCRLELAFRGVCFGLLSVFRATQPDISLKISSKKIWKIWLHTAPVPKAKWIEKAVSLLITIDPDASLRPWLCFFCLFLPTYRQLFPPAIAWPLLESLGLRHTYLD